MSYELYAVLRPSIRRPRLIRWLEEVGVPVDENGGAPYWAIRVVEDNSTPVVIRRRLLRELQVCDIETRQAYLALLDLGLKREAWDFLEDCRGRQNVEE